VRRHHQPPKQVGQDAAAAVAATMDNMLPHLQGAWAAVLDSPPHFPLRHAFHLPLDVARWDWDQIAVFNAHSFRWDYGVTPFTNWQIVVGAWAVYFTTLLLLKVRGKKTL